MYTVDYTFKGYKEKINQAQINEVHELYEIVYENNFHEVEKKLIQILDNILKRNPSQKSENRISDFSYIILLVDGFNDDYKEWLKETSRSWNSWMNINQQIYLASYSSNIKALELIFEKLFEYLEGDFIYSHEEIVKLLNSYKNKQKPSTNY